MRSIAMTVLVAAALTGAVGCSSLAGSSTGAGQAPTEATGMLETLTIAPETHAESYERELFEHWEQVEQPGLPDNCDAREATLYLQGDNVTVDGSCEATSGTWTGPYTGFTTSDDSELDIDHVVPLSAAWRSGAYAWSAEERERFANDLDQLLATESSANREKSDQDPSDWLPERDRCGYVTQWIEVKSNYDLTIDTDEHDALERVLASCAD